MRGGHFFWHWSLHLNPNWEESSKFYMGVSKNRGAPKWMVKIRENPMNKWDDLGGYQTTIFGSTPIWLQFLEHCLRVLSCFTLPSKPSQSWHTIGIFFQGILAHGRWMAKLVDLHLENRIFSNLGISPRFVWQESGCFWFLSDLFPMML